MASTSASTVGNDNELSLDNLISRIDNFLAQKSSRRKESKGHTFSDILPPLSADLSKLLEGISQGAKMISDQKKLLSNLSGEAQRTAVSALHGLGNAHWAAAGFLVIASVLERLEKVSFNQKECLVLLKRMNNLAKCIRLLKAKSGLDHELEKKIKDAFQFIVQGAIMCFTQIGMRKFYKFLLVSKNREDLQQLNLDIQHLYEDLTLHTMIANVDNRPTEFPYPDYAIGIDHQVKTVTEYLDCQGDMAVVAVVVYGVRGIGKTTITDAVFANLIKGLEAGYRTSNIELHEDVHLSKKIEELQAQILHDLTGQKHDISHYKLGQVELNKCLKEGPVLLYVDNVLREEDIEQILPKKLDNPKKFRLLLTARKRDAVATLESCGIECCQDYEIEPLGIEACLDLLHRKIVISRDHQMPKIRQIAEKCSGIPLVLELVGGYLRRRMRENMGAEAIERVLQGLEKGEPFSGNTQDMGYEPKFLFGLS
ncbi:uncharacterized protein LOC131070472 [Cryptomeria japonica]|uniref:uncharacterized protein LOC131070472 n=1 Tax=Cryptomeria japonica TaxID=3369 RepID=UPI0027DA64B3|nr:uncharacterized protein LOC131070472 [Cryptomeria japonica]